MTFQLFQLLDNIETREFRFMGTEFLRQKGIPISRKNYQLVYQGQLEKEATVKETLESLFTTFNVNLPHDFRGRSMSVSDVVVVKEDDKKTRAYYVDPFGFVDVTAEF
jgi:hypothetical protein